MGLSPSIHRAIPFLDENGLSTKLFLSPEPFSAEDPIRITCGQHYGLLIIIESTNIANRGMGWPSENGQ